MDLHPLIGCDRCGSRPPLIAAPQSKGFSS